MAAMNEEPPDIDDGDYSHVLRRMRAQHTWENTEAASWNVQSGLRQTLRDLQVKASQRKLRLFACACCRYAWYYLGTDFNRGAVEVAERYADGLADKAELSRAESAATGAARAAASSRPWQAAQGAARLAFALIPEWSTRAAQHHLLRHLFGVGQTPDRETGSWSATVVEIATALYVGDDCAFALHDALLDSGRMELADHFQQEQWHPKGCWALDRILNKA